ncbi:MAG: NAD-dependent epimerase/dehydratase family protein [Bdellovibrionales bacterium]|nr:NAD-dependent epimerase/dehydratase family protein [Bdellovibrionales bacterium]
MKILVTGGSGFLGQHLLKELEKGSHEIYALTHINRPIASSRIQMISGDVTQPESLQTALQHIEVVYHLASLMSDDPKMIRELFKVNVEGTRNLLKQSQQAGVRRFIYVSSVVTIGSGYTPNEVKDETSQNNTQSLKIENFDSKRLAEELVLSANHKNFQTLVFNPSLIYGAGDALKPIRAGQVKVARGRQRFYIEGGVSVVAVEDVVSVLIAALNKGNPGEKYILSGENLTIRELFSLIAETAGVPAPSKKIPTSLLLVLSKIITFLHLPGPLQYKNVKAATLWHWYNHNKAKEVFDFQPRPAKEAIANSVNWMKSKHLVK